MTVAVIDIGTNSIKLLIAQVEEGNKIKAIAEEAIITRLGRGVVQTGKLDKQKMSETIQVLQMFQEEVKTYGGDKIFLVATEAVRKARNRKVFVQMVRKKIGLEVEVLSPKKEALFSYQGAVSGIEITKQTDIVVVDIGGGSTELIRGQGKKSPVCQSLPLGAVSLTEKFISSDLPAPSRPARRSALAGGRDSFGNGKAGPIRDNDYLKLRRFIEAKSSGKQSVRRNTRLIGVGGTVVTLAAMDLGIELIVSKIEGYRLILKRVENILDRLRRTTLAEKKNMIGLTSARADIILAGSMILVTLMKSLGMTELVVSTRGMRYGCLLAQA